VTPGGVPEGDGVLALPFEADRPGYATLLELFRASTGRTQEALLPLYAAPAATGGGRHGAAVDWCYAALGALACEVGVWGPEVDGADPETVDAQFRRDQSRGVEDGASRIPQQEVAAGAQEDPRWERWLDDTRGGLGFVDWQPVDLGNGRQGLIGGWEPYTCFNPPADVLATALGGLDGFVRELAQGLPRVEVEVEEQRRNGRTGILRLHLENTGALPTGVGPDGPGFGTRLRLELPAGVSLLAGELEQELGHLPGRGRSATYDWLFVAPEDSVFRVVVESRWSPTVTKEIRL
jgi:hypothetical protein